MPSPKINIVAGLHQAFAFEVLTVTNATKGCTALTYKNATNTAQRAIFTIETTNVRYRYDGGAPTTAVGHLLYANDSLVISGRKNIDNLRFIQAGTATASVAVTYER